MPIEPTRHSSNNSVESGDSSGAGSTQFPRNPDPATAADPTSLTSSPPPNSKNSEGLNQTIPETNLDEDFDRSQSSVSHTSRANPEEQSIQSFDLENGQVTNPDPQEGQHSNNSSETPTEASEDGAPEGGGADSGPSLPAHLANLTPEEREALQQRMTREMAIDEARNSEPKRRIDRNAKQLYCSSIGTSTFLILLVLKVQEGMSISWIYVFIPLYFQYFMLFSFSLLDILDGYKSWVLQRQASPSDGILAGKRALARFQETLWHVACGCTSPFIARHLEYHSPSLVQAFIPVWVYGGFAVLISGIYIGYGIFTKCQFEGPLRLIGSLNSSAFALTVRVLPVLLVVNKLLGANYSWAVVFIPLWISVGVLAIIGCCVSCIVPVLVLTQEAAGRVLGWIVGIAALLMVIPAVCSLTFLTLLVEHLESDGDKPPLIAVVSPLIVMNILLALLTPLLVKIVNSTSNVLDAMQNTGPTVEGETPTSGKRPGVERVLTDIQPEMVFRQQTSTLFKRVVSDVTSDKPNTVNGGDPACYVCCERNRDSVLQPCGHGGLCYECAVEFAQTPTLGRHGDAESLPKCPLCRANVTEVLKLTGVAGTTTEFVAKTSWTILGISRRDSDLSSLTSIPNIGSAEVSNSTRAAEAGDIELGNGVVNGEIRFLTP
mmetsp:Transcript_53983/g.69318  ORF Transcript_53983/g.69318 Transcript_53983/m.69318 type:complete len:660 (-) Transcript_53983:255-2234(-)